MLSLLLKAASAILINLDLLLPCLLMVLAIRAWRKKTSLRPRTVVLCLLPLAITQCLPVGRWLIMALEERFPRPGPFPGGLPEDLTGIVLLGGSFVLPDSEDRGETVYNFAAPRVFEALALARRYPRARLVFTGTPFEAQLAARVFAEQGIDRDRITFESESLNTRDNAVNTRRLVSPKEGETWALATSALHMPRSVGLFRGAGWNVVPYSVNYTSSGKPAWRDWLAAPYGVNGLAWRTAAHEILGLIYHRLAGESP
ncbi:MAG TPA: YdcF family protein, partial [Planctomycetota bacterium]|nr:YdcF family protein [Planctomycetota bacterium]